MSSTARARNRGRRRGEGAGNRTWLVVIGVVVVIGIAAVIAVAASGGDDTSKATEHETGAVSVEGSPLPLFPDQGGDAAIGEPIPTLQGVSFDGKPITVGPNGKPQAIVVLSHSCPHCQAEVPRIVELENAGKLAGVDVTAIVTNTNPEYPNYPPSAWLEREKWPYPVLVDNTSNAAAASYGVTAFPFFVFVDADGNVAARATGELTPDSLTRAFEALAAGKPLASSSSGASTAR